MEEKNTVGAARHPPTYDAESINRAVERAANDPDFIDYSMSLLKGLRFPAFKNNIIEYARSINADQHVISLLQSLDGYIKFRDEYHIKKSLEENSAGMKKEYQLTDQKRE